MQGQTRIFQKPGRLLGLLREVVIDLNQNAVDFGQHVATTTEDKVLYSVHIDLNIIGLRDMEQTDHIGHRHAKGLIFENILQTGAILIEILTKC